MYFFHNGIINGAKMKEFHFRGRGFIEEGEVSGLFATKDGDNYLISNDKNANAIIYAPEIDFYLQRSLDDKNVKLKNLELLYEIRAIKYDLGSDKEYAAQVDNRLIIIASKDDFDGLKNSFDDIFDVSFCDEAEAKELSGELGNFELKKVNKLFREEILKASQILITKDDKQKELFVGVEKILEPSVLGEVKQKMVSRVGEYHYKKIVSYNESICQYHHRREHTCGICSDLCPTLGVKYNDSLMELVFSDIDCHGCGGCISACPSGAIDFTQFSLEAIYEVARRLEGKKLLIIPQNLVEDLDISLPKGVFPLVIEGAKFLSELHFLTLLQESETQIVFYTDVIAKGVRDAQKILNQIWQKRFGKDALFITMEKSELPALLGAQESIIGSNYKNSIRGKSKRASFASRLQFLVGTRELGTIDTGDVISYGQIRVDASKCTMCLSCVGACNVDALKGEEKTLSLNFNPSLCTNCGYCLSSCPEHCMSLEAGHIELSPSWFEYRELARDELFKCVECGEPFGTKKSVEKIVGLLSSAFSSDPAKLRTLYCCEKCKPKVILPTILKAQREGLSL